MRIPLNYSRITMCTAAGVAIAAGTFGYAGAQEYRQAPMLDARVDSGELPPVEERLPDDPEVIEPVENIGTYGGEIRRGLRGSSDHNSILRIVGPQGLTRWDPDYTRPIPNLAESFEVEDDGRTFIFKLRPGLKWSDGEPFDAEDIAFNIEDLVLNGDYSTVPPAYQIDGQPPEFEVVDDQTVKFTFAEPYGSFLAELSTPLGQHATLHPKHYCSQFHPTYNDNVDALIQENGVSDWVTLFQLKCGDIEIPSRWANPDKPTMDPWVVTEPYTGGSTRVILERNPYFWQVDTEGNQLPYIDRINNSIAQDVESLVLEVVAGKIDMQARHLDDPANRPVFAENMEDGGYAFYETVSDGNLMGLFPNLTHKDPKMRELMNQKDFRVALSVGIDREALIDIALLGQGEPWQVGPPEGYAGFDEKLGTQYLEYDPDLANELLDGLGYTERNSNGIRLMPDGTPLSFRIDTLPTLFPAANDILELIAQSWAEIGVEATLNNMERTLFYSRTSENNDHDMAIWGAGGAWRQGTLPQSLVAIHHDSRQGIPWVQWYKSNGAQGEEPPALMKQRMDLWNKARAQTDPEDFTAVMTEIGDIAAEQFEVIGISLTPPKYGVKNAKLRNVPESMPASWYYPTPAPTLPQQYYYEQ